MKKQTIILSLFMLVGCVIHIHGASSSGREQELISMVTDVGGGDAKLFKQSGYYFIQGISKGSAPSVLLGTVPLVNLYRAPRTLYGARWKLRKLRPDFRKRALLDLVQDYKIHLMPKKGEELAVLKQLLTFLVKNKKAASLVSQIKIIRDIDDSLDINATGTDRFPVMVIYPAEGGKKVAQKLLEMLYNEFKTTEGSDLRPRFNAKVTSLIWIAQGQGGDKDQRSYPEYFQPGRIYYDPKAMKDDPDADYRLIHPETGKPIEADQGFIDEIENQNNSKQISD